MGQLGPAWARRGQGERCWVLGVFSKQNQRDWLMDWVGLWQAEASGPHWGYACEFQGE